MVIMIIIEKFIKFLPDSSTRPFLATTNSGRKVIIKACLDENWGKILFNEYVAGEIANLIKLSWPRVAIATLSKNIVDELILKSPRLFSLECIAIEYIEGLKPVRPLTTSLKEQKYELSSFDNVVNYDFESLKQRNIQYLSKNFTTPQSQSQFYGLYIFELFVFLEDRKYDTLFLYQDKPFFIDGSLAFGGMSWEFRKLDYSCSTTSPKSIYLDGIVNQQNSEKRFLSEWIEKIEAITREDIEKILADIPRTWGISKNEIDFVFDLLTNKKSIFLNFCRRELLGQSF